MMAALLAQAGLHSVSLFTSVLLMDHGTGIAGQWGELAGILKELKSVVEDPSPF